MSVKVHDQGVELFDRLAADLPRLLERLLAAPLSPVVQHPEIPEAPGPFLVPEGQAADAGIDVERFRAQLEADEEFAAHFTAAKLRVADRDVRFIALEDPIERSVFEIYAALALDTLVLNSFETH